MGLWNLAFVTVSNILTPSLPSFYSQIWQLPSLPFSFSSHHIARNWKVSSFVIPQSVQSQLMLQMMVNDLTKVSQSVWGHTSKELHTLQAVLSFFSLSSPKFKCKKTFLLTLCPIIFRCPLLISHGNYFILFLLASRYLQGCFPSGQPQGSEGLSHCSLLWLNLTLHVLTSDQQE